MTDFLISLLTKPQSFLRDIANFTFKQFCTEVSSKALANLIDIVQTPNVDANKMLFAEGDDNDEEGVASGDDEEGGSESEESDDDDDDESDEDSAE